MKRVDCCRGKEIREKKLGSGRREKGFSEPALLLLVSTYNGSNTHQELCCLLKDVSRPEWNGNSFTDWDTRPTK